MKKLDRDEVHRLVVDEGLSDKEVTEMNLDKKERNKLHREGDDR